LPIVALLRLPHEHIDLVVRQERREQVHHLGLRAEDRQQVVIAHVLLTSPSAALPMMLQEGGVNAADRIGLGRGEKLQRN
jgi:hypothetical protein